MYFPGLFLFILMKKLNLWLIYRDFFMGKGDNPKSLTLNSGKDFDLSLKFCHQVKYFRTTDIHFNHF